SVGCRSDRNCVPARYGRWLRNNGRAASRRQRRHHAAGKQHCDWRGVTGLILTFGPIPGGPFHPAVNLSCGAPPGFTWRDSSAYFVAQISGACAGVAAPNLMFGDPPFFVSHHARNGGAQLFSEFVATFGLLLVIGFGARLQPQFVAFAVGAYITAAYW